VISVEPVESEPYYDFHVPVFNNYWASGLWHHNCGKSTVSIVTARSHGAKRVLIFCPPHLLSSWRNEVATVFPDAEYRVLSAVSEVDAVAEIPEGKFVISVLSRESAKLGHRLEGVDGPCPKCMVRTEISPDDKAKKRSRCEGYLAIPANDFAGIVRSLVVQLRPHAAEFSQFFPRGLSARSVAKRWLALGKVYGKDVPVYEGLPVDLFYRIREKLVEAGLGYGHDSPVKKAFVRWIAAVKPEPNVILDLVRRLKPEHHDYSYFAESLLLLLPPGGALGMAFELLASFPAASYSQQSSTKWFQEQYAKVQKLRNGKVDEAGEEEDSGHVPDHEKARIGNLALSVNESGQLQLGPHEFGSIEAAKDLLRALGELAAWEKGPVCGEPLYQSTPEPRRYPLAKYIVKRHRNTFDFVIIDEAHEAASSEAAQSIAAFRLTALRLPSILMTGTIMSGYAESLFAPFQATDKDFQEEFARGDISAFVDRYGYRERLVSDKEDGKVVAYGSQSDRVERSEKDLGSAPGVLPLFFFAHLLRGAVTLQKEDLRIDLPKLSQDRVVALASGDLLSNFDAMVKKLVEAIKRDRFDEELAGKLFGQLSEIPSYLDRATVDVGNGYKDYEVHYPESVGGDLVTSAKLFPKNEILPKEALMLDVVEREIKEGRRVMVFGWHLELLPRLARLLQERLGEEVPVLYAAKVPTAKRQDWIDKNIVKKKVRVMVANPVCVQTGLNNLVHFASIWQHENPGCNPITDRQSIGRIDRIGQKLETRVFRAFYGETLQEKMYDLHMNKVSVSVAADGLDPESAMLAAGVEQSSFVAGLSIGKALWKMMEEDGFGEDRPKLKLVVSGGKRR